MFIIIDGKTLKEVCEIEMNRLKKEHKVEFVHCIDHTHRILKVKTGFYIFDEIDMGKLKLPGSPA